MPPRPPTPALSPSPYFYLKGILSCSALKRVSLIAISTCELIYRAFCVLSGEWGVWAFVDPGRESRVSRAITSLYCTFLVLASLTAMSVRFPLGSFIHRGLSPSSFITFLSLSHGDRAVGPGASSTEGRWTSQCCLRFLTACWRPCVGMSSGDGDARQQGSPPLEEISRSTEANITKPKCVACVCPYD